MLALFLPLIQAQTCPATSAAISNNCPATICLPEASIVSPRQDFSAGSFIADVQAESTSALGAVPQLAATIDAGALLTASPNAFGGRVVPATLALSTGQTVGTVNVEWNPVAGSTSAIVVANSVVLTPNSLGPGVPPATTDAESLAVARQYFPWFGPTSALLIAEVEPLDRSVQGSAPSSTVRTAINAATGATMSGGEIALNNAAAAAVLSALSTANFFTTHNVARRIVGGCSRHGKAALHLALNSPVITDVIAVSSGALGAATDGLVGSCAETGAFLASPTRWSSWVNQSPGNINNFFSNGESLLNAIVGQGKNVLLHASAQDNWVNPLGMYAAYRAAGGAVLGLTTMPSAGSGRLVYSNEDSSTHCGSVSGPFNSATNTFIQGFQTSTSINAFTLASCPFSASECALVEQWAGAVEQCAADTCLTASDGECDDGGAGAEFSFCASATDTCDCGGGDRSASDNPCFPSTATVTKADGTVARLGDLEHGDAIKVLDREGALTTDTISGLSIAQPEAQATFLTLTTAAGANLTLTPEHHVPIGPSCCGTSKKAKDVEVGEKIYQVKEGTPTATAITKITKGNKQGLHSPVTTMGTYPIVDGFATAFDSATSMALASYAVPLLEATGTTAIFRRAFLAAGNKYIGQV